MENKSIDELNSVLKGEEMAVQAYERYLKDIHDNNVKEKFQSIQQDHKRHASDISTRIQDLGGQPNYGTGISGVMANAKLAFQDAINNDTLHILKQAYDGEDKGIAMVEEIIKGDLDKDSMNLVNGIMSTDHQHLRDLAKMISDYELKQ